MSHRAWLDPETCVLLDVLLERAHLYALVRSTGNRMALEIAEAEMLEAVRRDATVRGMESDEAVAGVGL
jgi:hypothetical protein